MAAVALIAGFEDLRLCAYLCPAGVPTVGWGHTGPDVFIGKSVMTKDQADRTLLDDITHCVNQVKAACAKQPPMPNQLGALVSFAFNCRGWKNSTVIRQHNKGNFEAASRALNLWNKATVNKQLVVLNGLTRRRAAEQVLYMTPEPDAPREPMPQAIETESSVVTSPIAQSGATTAAGGGILVALEAFKGDASAFGQWLSWGKSWIADAFGVPPNMILPAVLVIAGLVAIRTRWKQRSDGWA